MSVTVEITTKLVTITCCRTDCGILFAVPERWQQTRRRDHSDFFCPNGHPQRYNARSEEEKLREELASAQRSLKWQREDNRRLADDNMTLARSRTALRGVVTRLRRKAVAGECAFCGHRFPDVAAHVAELHPGVEPEASDSDEQGTDVDAV